MIELKGKYTSAKIFIDEVEQDAISTILNIINSPTSADMPIRIMPDVHNGAGGIVIGFTMPINNFLNPNHIGVDIGCGLISGKFSKDYKLDLEKINKEIRERIPMGINIHANSIFTDIPFDDVQKIADIFTKKFNDKFGTSYVAPVYNSKWLINKLKDINIDIKTFFNSIGTLGSGNHYCELGVSENTSDYWITLHSGSRNFGLKIANYWVNVANGKVKKVSKSYTDELNYIINNTFPKNLIPSKIEELKNKYNLGINKEYLSGEDMMGYLYDMIFAQQYALWNRQTMLNIIKDILKINKFDEVINTIHNYVDFNDFIIRKGSISSYKNVKMLIPFNMRDGMVLCEGKSNEDYNFSAPHGSGRLMSRTKAKETIDLNLFKKTMENVYSTSVCKSTLDESPFAYKDSDLIEKLIEPTASILDRIKPILNIKDIGETISWKEKKLKKIKKT